MLSRIEARSEAVLVLALTGLVISVSFVPPPGIVVAAGLVAVVLTTTAWRKRMPAGTSMGLLLVAVLAAASTGLGPQQVVFALAFVVYGVVIARARWLRDGVGWPRAGVLDAPIATFITVFAVVSGAIAMLWYTITQPDLTDLIAMMPDWPVWGLVPLGVAFAVVNASLEEAIYRGVVQDALERTIGVGNAALVLQAAAFAVLHVYGGFPRGAAGLGLTFVYGLAMGVLRRRSGGLLAPIVAHTITDLMIVGLVLSEIAG